MSSVVPPTTALPLGVLVQAITFCFARSASRFGLVRSASWSTVVASDERASSISRWISSGDRCTVTPGSFHQCRSPESLGHVPRSLLVASGGRAADRQAEDESCGGATAEDDDEAGR